MTGINTFDFNVTSTEMRVEFELEINGEYQITMFKN